MNVSQLGIEAENLSWRCDGYQDQHVSEDNQDGDVVVAQEPRIEPEITLHAFTGWSAPRTMRCHKKRDIMKQQC